MTPSQPQLASLFAPLTGQRFATYGAFEAAVRERFRAERRAFPSEFTYRDAISWASSSGHVAVRDGQLVVGEPPATEAA